MLDILQSGINAPDLALLANRCALGAFFTSSGYHKLFNHERHSALTKTLISCRVPFISFNQWFVPGVEMFGGLSMLSGILSPLAAVGLSFICLIATLTDGRKRIAGYQPIDMADTLCDILYLPEVLYISALAIVILAGPGSLTLASLVF